MCIRDSDKTGFSDKWTENSYEVWLATLVTNLKNTLSKKKEESREDEKLSKETSDEENEIWYSSIFYGELTQNWLKVTN